MGLIPAPTCTPKNLTTQFAVAVYAEVDSTGNITRTTAGDNDKNERNTAEDAEMLYVLFFSSRMLWPLLRLNDTPNALYILLQ